MTDRAADRHWIAAGLVVATLVLWLGLMVPLIQLARLPDDRTGTVLVVFRPGTATADILSAIIAADASIVRTTWFSAGWVVNSDQPGLVGRLRAAGAWAAFEPIAGDIVAVSGCMGPLPPVDPARIAVGSRR